MSSHVKTSTGPASLPVARPDAATENNTRKLLTGHNLFMLACCAVMIAAAGIVIAGAPAGLSLTETLLLAAPMLGCVTMHLVMHRVMGKPCHARAGKEQRND